MFGTKPCYLLILLFCLHCHSYGQKAKYAGAKFGKHLRIAGKIGNNIHVWSSSTQQVHIYPEETTFTLHIFSEDLQLKAEKKIELGKARSWNLNFQATDSCYYADIRYITDRNERLLLKVEQDGKTTDVSETPGLWTQALISDQPGREYSISLKNNNLFSAKIDNNNIDKSINQNDIIMIGNEHLKQPEYLKKIIIKKTSIKNKNKNSQRVYGSTLENFFFPLTKATDTSLFVCAYLEPEKKGNRDNFNGSPFLFISQFDTSLSEINNAPLLLKAKQREKNEIFVPLNMFPMRERLFIISLGQYLKGNIAYSASSMNYGYVTTSLRITITDKRTGLFKDSVIESKSGPYNYEWENSFMSTAENRIDLFCVQNYSLFKRGISYLSIDMNGNMNERDMVVDGHYDYFLPSARIIAAGVLLMPCRRKGRMDLLKLEYNHTN